MSNPSICSDFEKGMQQPRPLPFVGDVRRPAAVLSEVALGGLRGDALAERDLPRLGLPIPQQVGSMLSLIIARRRKYRYLPPVQLQQGVRHQRLPGPHPPAEAVPEQH